MKWLAQNLPHATLCVLEGVGHFPYSRPPGHSRSGWQRSSMTDIMLPIKNREVKMVQTYGLTHINLAVRDLGRALLFYEQVFGLREYGRGDGLVHTRASGRHDIVTFAEDPATAGLSGGVAHFGFRLVDPDDIDRAIAEVERAGGRLLRRGEFAPGLPYAYVADPDGYEIEIWFE